MSLEFDDNESNLDFSFEQEPPSCTMCGGPGAYLGALGRLEWFRCVNCGIEFNVAAPAAEWRGENV